MGGYKRYWGISGKKCTCNYAKSEYNESTELFVLDGTKAPIRFIFIHVVASHCVKIETNRKDVIVWQRKAS